MPLGPPPHRGATAYRLLERDDRGVDGPGVDAFTPWYDCELRVKAKPQVKQWVVSFTASDFDPTSHADFGVDTHPGVGGGTHRRRAPVERC